MEGLNAHHWDEDERQRLQHTMDTSTQATFCGVDLVSRYMHNIIIHNARFIILVVQCLDLPLSFLSHRKILFTKKPNSQSLVAHIFHLVNVLTQLLQLAARGSKIWKMLE